LASRWRAQILAARHTRVLQQPVKGPAGRWHRYKSWTFSPSPSSFQLPDSRRSLDRRSRLADDFRPTRENSFVQNPINSGRLIAMKNLLAAAVLTCAIGAAQDTPRAEVFLGYTYVRVNSATDVPAFSANGGSGQFVLNAGKWLGLVADLGAVHNGNIGGYNL